LNTGGRSVYKLENNVLYPAGSLMERSKCEAKVCDLQTQNKSMEVQSMIGFSKRETCMVNELRDHRK